MPLISAADLDFALQDFSGAPCPNVVYGAQSCWGDLKRGTVDEASDNGLRRLGTHITLVIRDGALTSLRDDTAITVDGGAYVIRDIGIALPDGTRVLTLAEVA